MAIPDTFDQVIQRTTPPDAITGIDTESAMVRVSSISKPD